MRMRIAGGLTAVLLLAAAAAFAVTAAALAKEQVFKNEFETSGIDVRIEQFMETKGGIVRLEDDKPVLPGETISYMPRVSNLREDSYVRVKFEMRSQPGEKTVGTQECFSELYPGWVLRGDYYYYTHVLSKNESRFVLKNMLIPEELEECHEGLRVHATVDAIQAKNFTPDFESIHPWGTVEILQARQDQEACVSSGAARPVSDLEFTYAREGVFECSTEDLFSNFDSFTPGDSCRETLTMRNESGDEMEVFFRTRNTSSRLLQEMKLSIFCGGSRIYTGDLASSELESFIKIGRINPGESGKLQFEVSMPESADNRYSLLRDDVTWIIAIKAVEGKQGSRSIGSADAVKTGDELTPVIIAALALAAAMATLAALIVSGRRKRYGR